MTSERTSVVARSRDLLAVTLLAGAAGAVVVSSAPVPVRLIFSLPLIFVLPGYAVAAAIFGDARLDRAQWILLSVGLSIVTAILVALVLYLTPFDLRAGSWGWALVLVVFAGSGIAVLRRRNQEGWQRPRLPSLRVRRTAILVALVLYLTPFDDRAGSWGWALVLVVVAGSGIAVLRRRNREGRQRPRLPRLRARDALLLLAAAAVAAGAVAFARTALPAKNVQGYTALWLLPGHNRSMRVGITSGELHPMTYQLRLRLGPRHAYTRSVSLEPGQRWEEIVRFRSPGNTAGVPVTANLFREGSRRIYRQVRARLTQ
jgi:uncharacterized membrane protein